MGETEKNIQAVFDNAAKKDAVLVFDEAEGLFASRSSSQISSAGGAGRAYTMCVGLLLQNIENHPGVCIIITNLKEAIDKAFFRRFRFVLDFMVPDATLREPLWKVSFPQECPLASNVSMSELAKYEMTGGNIKNALLNAATRASLRSSNDGERKEVTMEDLVFACTAQKCPRRTNPRRISIGPTPCILKAAFSRRPRGILLKCS